MSRLGMILFAVMTDNTSAPGIAEAWLYYLFCVKWSLIFFQLSQQCLLHLTKIETPLSLFYEQKFQKSKSQP